ncbi:hypothetical protein [Pinisolibacter aquiterrae]|uniref:hypothetical protein n=1 Tax=Pinisolibacter aquiterrae TaxID=2815579 RepID=UPI001C3CDDD2|nr:hypothetical protein [Pinisolibacter aquiterrae]MBV5264113.1 hypothetical protein [Pinisolibacter aquiterrae]MCC8233792.1 hypothetical protein [Pinisolibacter aquiterrae]
MVLRREPTTADTTIDLAVLRDALRAARGRIALAALAAAVLVGGLAVWRADPLVMEARILIEPIAAPGEAASESGRAARDDRLIATQIGLLGSSGLLRRVVAGAAADPRHPLDAFGDAGRDGDGLDREDRRLAALRAALTVERVDRSRLIALRLATPDRGSGEHLLATVWHDYASGLAEARGRAEAEAERRRGAEVAEARRRLAEAETMPAPVAAAPVADPEADAARAERAEGETVLKRLEDFADAGEKGADRAVDAGLTDGLRRLRERRGLLRSRIAELSVVYLENHPLLKEATERLADLHREIRAELPRAVAAQKAALAAIDRRIAERETATTASIPEAAPVPAAAAADLPRLRAALAEALARRDAAYLEALGQAAVAANLVGAPDVVETPSNTRPIVAAGLAALFGAGLAASLAAVFGAAPARRRDRVAPVAEIPAPIETRVEEPVAIAPSRPVDADAPRRAALYAEATDERIADLWDQIEAEIPRGRRIVVTSVTDAARAHAAARLLWANAAVAQGSACLVDLAATVPEPESENAGFSDILAGRAAFSEAIHHDHDCGGWVVPAGVEPLEPATFGDEGVAGILDALAATWADVVVDVGRLEAGEGLATLLIGADVIVLAEDDRDDPRVLRALDALLMADKAVWLIDPPLEEASRDLYAADGAETAAWADAA